MVAVSFDVALHVFAIALGVMQGMFGVMPVMLGNALSAAARHVALDALLDLVHYPVDRGLEVALEGVRVELSLGIAAEAGYKRGGCERNRPILAARRSFPFLPGAPGRPSSL